MRRTSHSKKDSRKFRRRLKREIKSMALNKAVDTDSNHSEMLQTAPNLFASLLTQWWRVVGKSGRKIRSCPRLVEHRGDGPPFQKGVTGRSSEL